MRSLERWTAMTSAERRAAIRAAWTLPLSALLVRCLGLQRAQTILGRFPGGRLPASLSGVRARKLVTSAAARLPIHTSCLERSLALWHLLGAAPADLRIGVRRAPTGIQAHAWVEHEGMTLDPSGSDPEQYRAFPGAIAPPHA